MSAIKEYLNQFQDLLVGINLKEEDLPLKYIKEELDLLEKIVDNVATKINTQDNTVTKATEELHSLYLTTLESLSNKVEYIRDTAEAFSKLNITYDRNSLLDYKVFNLLQSDTCVYDYESQGYTLRKNPVTSKATHDSTAVDRVVYNTNSSLHDSIQLKLPEAYIYNSVSVSVLGVDGVVRNYYKDLSTIPDKTSITFTHDEIISSTSLVVSLGHISPDDYTEQEKLNMNNQVTVELCLSNYLQHGKIEVDPVELLSAKYLSFNQTLTLGANTYLNYNLNINGISFTIPVGSSYVCKRLDMVNFKEVDKIVKLYIGDQYTEEDLTETSLKEVEEKNSKYIVYIPKIKQNIILNKILKTLGGTSFALVNHNLSKYIEIELNIEMYSFDKNNTPLLKNIIGFTKNE